MRKQENGEHADTKKVEKENGATGEQRNRRTDSKKQEKRGTSEQEHGETEESETEGKAGVCARGPTKPQRTMDAANRTARVACTPGTDYASSLHVRGCRSWGSEGGRRYSFGV